MKMSIKPELGVTAVSPVEVRLTRREQEILHLTIKEYTSREIGDLLNISSRTVEVHRQNLIRKFGVKSLVGLVREAVLMVCRKEQSAHTIAKGSEFSPKITYFSETGELEIKGKALVLERPETYKRMVDYLLTTNAFEEKDLKCVVELSDIDVNSQKILYDFLKNIELLYKEGKSGGITWRYSQDKPDMKEVGDDFASMVEMPFAVVMN